MNAWSAGFSRRIRSRSASTASMGESARAPNARDSSATVAHTGSICVMRHLLLFAACCDPAAPGAELSRLTGCGTESRWAPDEARGSPRREAHAAGRAEPEARRANPEIPASVSEPHSASRATENVPGEPGEPPPG